MKIISNLIDKLDTTISPAIFKNSNFFSYNIYNYLFQKNIMSKYYRNNDLIFNYLKKGYVKLDSVPSNQIDDLINILDKLNPLKKTKNYVYNYKINDEVLNKIKHMVNYYLSDFLNNFSKFYNMRVKLGKIRISRNYPIPENHNKEEYSNFFHSDAFTCNLLRVFVNLQDVSESEGPMTLVKKDKKKLFLRETNYKTRYSYKKIKNKDHYFINSGNKGDVLLCDTTEILHRAGDIEEGNYRDMLFLDFLAYPFKDSGAFLSDDLILSGEMIKKIAKPKGIKNLIEIYKACKN